MLLALTLSLLLSPQQASGPHPVAPAAAPASTRLMDLTGDGRLDQLRSGPAGELSVAVNVGSREFLEIIQPLPPVQLTDCLVADLDGDDLLDLYLLSPEDDVALLGDGAGHFRDGSASLGLIEHGVGVAVSRLDVDGDGILDLLVHNTVGDVLFWGRGDGTYRIAAETAAAAEPTAASPDPRAACVTRGASPDSATSAPVGVGGAPQLPGALSAGPSPVLKSGGVLGSDLRVDGATGRPEPFFPFDVLAAFFDPRYVNDNLGEVDSMDVIDGSLTGPDVSTSSGDVIHTGGRLGVGTVTPQWTMDVQSFDALTLQVTNSGFASAGVPYVTALSARTTNDFGRTVTVSADSPFSFGTYVEHDHPSVSPAIWAASAATSESGTGVYGATAHGPGYGVIGVNTSYDVDATAVQAEAWGANSRAVNAMTFDTGPGVAYGVHATSMSEDGYGVYGESWNTSISTSASAGVMGTGGTGVRAESSVASGNGLVATAYGPSAYAVYGESDAYAGYFSGDVNVNGSLTASSKSFRIDHPLDPARRYLDHACAESDERLNIYTGTVVLDVQGAARVSMPGWFDAVNADPRYQLTCVGAFAPVYVAQELEHGAFVIAGGLPGMKVCWTVTAVRDDPWARAHPLQVEAQKPPHEQGSYLNPELYGQPPERSAVRAKQSLPPGPPPPRTLPEPSAVTR